MKVSFGVRNTRHSMKGKLCPESESFQFLVFDN